MKRVGLLVRRLLRLGPRLRAEEIAWRGLHGRRAQRDHRIARGQAKVHREEAVVIVRTAWVSRSPGE